MKNLWILILVFFSIYNIPQAQDTETHPLQIGITPFITATDFSDFWTNSSNKNRSATDRQYAISFSKDLIQDMNLGEDKQMYWSVTARFTRLNYELESSREYALLDRSEVQLLSSSLSTVPLLDLSEFDLNLESLMLGTSLRLVSKNAWLKLDGGLQYQHLSYTAQPITSIEVSDFANGIKPYGELNIGLGKRLFLQLTGTVSATNKMQNTRTDLLYWDEGSLQWQAVNYQHRNLWFSLALGGGLRW